MWRPGYKTERKTILWSRLLHFRFVFELYFFILPALVRLVRLAHISYDERAVQTIWKGRNLACISKTAKHENIGRSLKSLTAMNCVALTCLSSLQLLADLSVVMLVIYWRTTFLKKNACSSIYVGAFKAFDNKWAHKSNISELQHEAQQNMAARGLTSPSELFAT